MTISNLDPGDPIDDVWVDAVQGNIGNGWSTFTPTITASSSGPTQGNSTLSGRYRMINDHTVTFTVRYIVGSTFSAGSGFYQFNIPTPADSVGYGAIGSCYVLISGTEWVGIARIFGSTVVLEVPKQDGTTTSGHAVPAGLVGAAFPSAPGTGSEYRFTITYEA